ncbi:MAG: Spy/CpxP family protein refolding chaperone [Bryobacteraceae bacterium]|nr:Spy/CpxP family protein refolding chaperone [Bryobacteraceae bacterium]
MVTLAAGALMAQGLRGKGPGSFMEGRGQRLEMLATFLDLTPVQKEQMEKIMQASRGEAKPFVEQLRKGHDEMSAAVKAGKPDAELQRIAEAQGAIVGKLIAVHAQGMSQAYALLTPDQKAKADKLHDQLKSRFAGRFGGF